MSFFPLQCTNKDCNKAFDGRLVVPESIDPRIINYCPWCGYSVKRLPKNTRLTMVGSGTVKKASSKREDENTFTTLPAIHSLRGSSVSQLRTIYDRAQALLNSKVQSNIDRQEEDEDNDDFCVIENNNPCNELLNSINLDAIFDKIKQQHGQQQQQPPAAPLTIPNAIIHVVDNGKNSNSLHKDIKTAHEINVLPSSKHPQENLPLNLFIWDKDTRVRVHRIPDITDKSNQLVEENIYVILRPSLFALIGSKKNIYQTYGKDMDIKYLRQVNINENYNRSRSNNTCSKFKKWFILNAALQRYIAMHPNGNEFLDWFDKCVKKPRN